MQRATHKVTWWKDDATTTSRSRLVDRRLNRTCVQRLAVTHRAVVFDVIYIDEHNRDGHSALRISTHFYNTIDDIQRAIDALQALT